jgi:alcohol-forming fatty acyl-CoA reductase
MGKVFVEKLLRCTEVGCIYLLMRMKKGLDAKDRLDKMFKDPVGYSNYFIYINFFCMVCII